MKKELKLLSQEEKKYVKNVNTVNDAYKSILEIKVQKTKYQFDY